MKTRIILSFAGALAIGFLTAASVQAVPTTYQYTGNPFTDVDPPYTTSDFVSGMVTLAGPLAPNMPLTSVTPTAFTLFDGVQTITNLNALSSSFSFSTGPTGAITGWNVFSGSPTGFIITNSVIQPPLDRGELLELGDHLGTVRTSGTWALVSSSVPDTGSTLSLMTLTLMALGLVARRFKRAAA